METQNLIDKGLSYSNLGKLSLLQVVDLNLRETNIG